MVDDRTETAAEEVDDTGTKDFWFGVIGVSTMVVIAICFAIFS
jgi:hypothetical protein